MPNSPVLWVRRPGMLVESWDASINIFDGAVTAPSVAEQPAAPAQRVTAGFALQSFLSNRGTGGGP